MASQEPFSTSLGDICHGIDSLTDSDLRENAGLGLLLDWQLVNFLAKQEYQLVRQSFTWKDDEVLMVVKVVKDDTPYVVFVSRQSPISCMRTFVRKMRDGSVSFYPDKYA